MWLVLWLVLPLPPMAGVHVSIHTLTESLWSLTSAPVDLADTNNTRWGWLQREPIARSYSMVYSVVYSVVYSIVYSRVLRIFVSGLDQELVFDGP